MIDGGGMEGLPAVFHGKARVFGDDVNTDYIISSRRKRDTVDPKEISQYLMEDIRPGFGSLVEPGDIIVAGTNFGCGSAMEIAPLVIAASGIRVILARSFARTFYRNGINAGLFLVEVDTRGITEPDILEVALDENSAAVRDVDKELSLDGNGPRGVLRRIVVEGGLLPYIARHGGLTGR